MTLEEGRQLLAGEGLDFAELYFENERDYWNDVLPWTPHSQRECAMTVLRLQAPNGRRHLDMQFCDGEFEDLWFGGFAFELWESKSPHTELLDCIRDVMIAKSWCVVVVNRKTGGWLGDAMFSTKDDDMVVDRKTGGWLGDAAFSSEDDDRLQKKLVKLRRPRTWWERVFRTQRLYEVYDWNEYHRIER